MKSNIPFEKCPKCGGEPENIERIYTAYGVRENYEGDVIDIKDIEDVSYYCNSCMEQWAEGDIIDDYEEQAKEEEYQKALEKIKDYD